jgi:alanine racemase
MPRPIRAVVDLDALRHNLAVVRRHAGRARVMAVVKADAYGHGLARVLPVLREAEGLAVLEVEAAIAIRRCGYRGRVVLLEGCFDPRDLEEAAAHALVPVVHQRSQLDALLAAELHRPVDVILKLDSGMHRLGFGETAFRDALIALERHPRVSGITLMTHFAGADEGLGVAEQLAAFRRACGHTQHPVTLANSAALIRHPETRGDWVRPGIMLYGASPFPAEPAMSLGLRPAMTLESRIIAVQHVKAGEGVGYGWTFRAERDMRVGIVACGYADGYPRLAGTGTPIAVDGALTRTLGRVSMDMLFADLTDLPAAGVGSAVECWGARVPVDAVAASAGTVGYELLCALAPRVPVSVVGAVGAGEVPSPARPALGAGGPAS